MKQSTLFKNIHWISRLLKVGQCFSPHFKYDWRVAKTGAHALFTDQPSTKCQAINHALRQNEDVLLAMAKMNAARFTFTATFNIRYGNG